jgi:rhamnosyltransferase
MNIIAGIVLYNPDLERLKENINSIIDQVDEVLLVDNGSENFDEVMNKFNVEKIKMIRNYRNTGIAAALNQILEYSLMNNVEWALTLDQDSVVANNIIQEYKRYIDLDKIGMISCEIIDRNFTLNDYKNTNLKEKQDISECITSGCLTNVKAWEDSGKFDEKMFIDFVDFDICQRIRRKGYKLIKVNTTSILHELGNSRAKNIFGMKFILYNHAPIRNYYLSRNKVYYTRKYKKGFLALRSYLSIIFRAILVLLFEKNKSKKVNLILKGFFEGFTM